MAIKKIIRNIVPYQLRVLLNPLWKFLRHASYRQRALYTKTRTKTAVESQMIFYEAYHGESMTGNPWAVFTYLLDDQEFADFTHVWAIVDSAVFPDDFKSRENVKVVQYKSREYATHLATAKYLINDTTFPAYFHKRPEQVYINIWHGTPLKTMGMDIKQRGFADHRNIQRNFLMTDYFVSPNKYTYEKLLTSHDVNTLFNGEILDVGYPRVDLMFNVNQDELRKRVGVTTNQKVILYAPTWRGSVGEKRNQSEQLLNDMQKLQSSLDDDTIVLLKSHYYAHDFFKQEGFANYIVSPAIDTNELLSIVDILVTDYSSIFFEFLPLNRPVIFYANDLADYQIERGTYIPMDELPGPLCYTIDELVESIAHADWIQRKYRDKHKQFLDEFCYHDDGGATGRLVDAIFHGKPTDSKFKIDTNKTKILMYGGGFLNNGITTSVINLLNTIDYDRFDVTLIDHGTNIKESKIFHMQKVNEHVHHIFRIGTWNATLTDLYRHTVFLETGHLKLAPTAMYKSELTRLTGNTDFDIGIDFGGYSPFWAALFAYGNFKRKSIYMHSDMSKEVDKKVHNKYPHRKNLRVIFSLYDHFDKVVSVSELAHKENKKNLNGYVSNEKKMDFVANAIDYEWIFDMSDKHAPQQQELLAEFAEEITAIPLDQTFDYPSPQDSDTNFITIGRLSPEKDHAKLIHAFSRLVSINTNVMLYIVGEGALEYDLHMLVGQLHLDNHVVFTGQLGNPYTLLNQCDCFVLSSNYEGQALVLIEALTLGKAVITTDIPGPRSVVEDSYGMIVDNSIDGLAEGMENFLHNQSTGARPFDYEAYQNEAIQMFYDKICDWENNLQ